MLHILCAVIFIMLNKSFGIFVQKRQAFTISTMYVYVIFVFLRRENTFSFHFFDFLQATLFQLFKYFFTFLGNLRKACETILNQKTLFFKKKKRSNKNDYYWHTSGWLFFFFWLLFFLFFSRFNILLKMKDNTTFFLD